MLSEEYEELLRALCGDSLPQDTVDRLVNDLTDKELRRRLFRLLDNIDKMKHPRLRRFGQRRR
jgi:hypothetical protein